MIFGIVYIYLPFMVLPLYATLERLDRCFLEASLDLGAGQWRTLFSVTVPLAMPGIISGVILVFIPALGTFVISDLLGGPDSQLIGNVDRAPVQVGQQPAARCGDVVHPALPDLRRPGVARLARRPRGGAWLTGRARSTTPAAGGCGCGCSAIFVFLYAPIVCLVAFSFNDSRRNIVWQGFTLDYYGRALRNGPLIEAFVNSLVVALISTVIATIIGALLALALWRFRFPGSTAIEAASALPIVIPEICMGVALLVFFSRVGWPTGLPWPLNLSSIIVSHVAFSFPFVTVVVRSRMAGFDRSLEEAPRTWALPSGRRSGTSLCPS